LQYPNDAVRAVAGYQCLPKLPNVACQNFPDFLEKYPAYSSWQGVAEFAFGWV
jgi:hypothetical protein